MFEQLFDNFYFHIFFSYFLDRSNVFDDFFLDGLLKQLGVRKNYFNF